MKTVDVLKELTAILRKRGWTARIRLDYVIRLQGPYEKRFRRNPLDALAFHLHGTSNYKWEVPGEILGLNEDQVMDLHLACDTRWCRPILRRKLLEACGVKDPKFIEALEFMESIVPKRKLEKLLSHLSVEDRDALETATSKLALKQIEEILRNSC